MGICRFLQGASWIEASRTLRAGLEFIHSCMHLCILYSSGIYWTLIRCLVLGTHCEEADGVPVPSKVDFPFWWAQ